MKTVVMLLLVGGGLAFIAAHIFWYIKPSDIKGMAALNTQLHNGQPTVVELYSNL